MMKNRVKCKISQNEENKCEKIYIEKEKPLKKEQYEYLFQKVIKIIDQKHYHLLGAEKSKIARFIADNYGEIFQIIELFFANHGDHMNNNLSDQKK
jgi:hypothetical protein